MWGGFFCCVCNKFVFLNRALKQCFGAINTKCLMHTYAQQNCNHLRVFGCNLLRTVEFTVHQRNESRRNQMKEIPARIVKNHLVDVCTNAMMGIYLDSWLHIVIEHCSIFL